MRPLVLALAVAAAALQLGFALQWNLADHAGALLIGWSAALCLLYVRFRGAEFTSGTIERFAGAALVLSACGSAILGRQAYRPVDRLLPLVAGLGIALMASGWRRLTSYGREGALLALPVLDPLPAVVVRLVLPLRPTAAVAEALLHAVRFPVEREGTLLRVADTTVEVQDACSGLGSIAQLLALAVLTMCLFRTTTLQKALLVASAIVVGFAVNATRVAFLVIVATRGAAAWDFWERPGPGSNLFPLVATAAAASCWWVILRARRGPRSSRRGWETGRAAHERAPPIRPDADTP